MGVRTHNYFLNRNNIVQIYMIIFDMECSIMNQVDIEVDAGGALT